MPRGVSVVAEKNGTSEAQAQAIFAEAAERKAKKTDWGFYSYGDGPPAAGGGVGGFSWFASRREMLEAVRAHLVYFCPGPDTKDPATVAKEVATAVKGMGSSASGREAARNRANAALKGFAQIEWWGTFASLLEGDGAFERGIRASFRSEDEEDDEEPGGKGKAADRPITAGELAAFREYLQMYGM